MFRETLRVDTLPVTGQLGVLYIVNPGSRSVYWTGTAWQQLELRAAPTPANYNVFGAF